MNTFLHNLTNYSNLKTTENGALAYSTTNSALYDLFAFGGAYRERSLDDTIQLFKAAFEENPSLALKCLFYLRDVRGGQGERKFFRICFNWLANTYPLIAKKNLINVSEYGRWDDLIYSTLDSPIFKDTIEIISAQLKEDEKTDMPSLLGKWLPSENASSQKTKNAARIVCTALKLSPREYRKKLSALRTKINVLEKLMSENRWEEIEFDHIPSKAGLLYKEAFLRKESICMQYAAFINDKHSKVNASTLYPYEIIEKALAPGETSRAILEKYWNCLPDYFGEKECNMICVVDTSGSMYGRPITVAVSLGIYCAERNRGEFKDYYISFSSKPQLTKVKGTDIVDKVRRIWSTNICENTNLEAVFDLLLETAKRSKKEDIPEIVTIISDMEIDRCVSTKAASTIETAMAEIRKKWDTEGIKMPRLIFWNVNARNNTILDRDENVSFVSGCSPVVFEQVMSGKTGMQLMLDKITSERYDKVHI